MLWVLVIIIVALFELYYDLKNMCFGCYYLIVFVCRVCENIFHVRTL